MNDCGTILVVGHDETTRSAATLVVRQLGYDVSVLGSGDGLVDVLDGDRPALAIVELPGESSGLELLHELHETFGDDFPVILVSADRTAALDRVAGFMLGADDYVTKPFDTDELLARVRRSLRRAGNGNGNGKPKNTVNLSPREREILALLADGKTPKQIAAALVISPKTVAIDSLTMRAGPHLATDPTRFAGARRRRRRCVRTGMTMARPTVCLVGGPDVDARLDLMRLLSRDFDVCAVGTDARLAASFAEAGFRFRHYRMSRLVNPPLDAYTVWRLVRIFRAVRPTIVHTFDTKPGVWGRLAARLAGVPIVVGTLPGLGSLYASPNWKGRLIRLVYQPLQKLACRWADLTVLQNADDAEELERRGVVPHGRAAIISGSGVRTDVFALPRRDDGEPARRAELGLHESGIVVAMISRIVRSKGVLDFAAAARAVRQVEPGINFLLVGPADNGSLDALTAEELRELRGDVTWVGPRRDVKDILALSDIFVFPSFYREGVPRVLVEAASMALPLIAADGPGSRDVVEDGVNGVLVPPKDPAAIADAVLRLARAPELRVRFGERSRELAVSRFDVFIVAEQTRSLYQALLRDKGRVEAA